MNIHHLELFFYVAKYGGISEAARNMPYGIQQPAVSGQVIQLEDFLGVTLFQRRPFALTPAGQELFVFIEPFFANLDNVAEKLRGGASQRIRIGASEPILRDHLPDILQNIRKKFPRLKVAFLQGYQPDLESGLKNHEIDLAVTVLDAKPGPGINSLPLLQLPLVLLVEKTSTVTSAGELWRRDRIDETLISLPPNETICKNFQQSLSRLKVDWFTGIEVNSLNLIETYVANGFGIGLAVLAPKAKLDPRIRVLPLEDVAPVTLGAIWEGKPTPLLQAFLKEMQRRVELLLK